MANIMGWVTKALRKPPSLPIIFPTGGFKTVPPSAVLEEERFEQFKLGRDYPANIGEVLTSRYQVVGKLGFGTTSTVWLARDLECHRYISLKIYTLDEDNDREFKIYKQLNQGIRGTPFMLISGMHWISSQFPRSYSVLGW
ncbi:hypothetical protein N7488_001246 [Penicillium malachiteum]|nr:hypothetical protein N7488_001246 [Penicillium malachiteum]